ncbi:thymidine phosphorylase [Rhizobium sp. C1]|uniref:thymidine phosphorylase n=1 Tax=Rhizobium sp. C1 TaxID=1349799 RepID=UPI001E413320|nr:thymidine phosphorylase [Rhizobium sp. C1]MCD2178950.1 thymidine phosphorylase [Rhizobium sp. C1]
MLPQETILAKRNGETLTAEEIARFVEGFTKGEISEGQVAAFAMAVWFKGMRRDETVALTLAMRDSGDVLDWSDIGRPIADKHSTGGVGDNVSLMLAPIVASLGLAVPMISGRGLGHTGGTLDKLESIAGYNIMSGEAVFRKTVREVGCAIIGQTGDLAPADKRLYAIRDVTATVDSVPLITASILSKKLAAGLETLVLDVKVGSGAFMSDMEEARALARSLVEVANGAGVKTSALITDMNEPLADCAGNAVEVIHAVEFLKGLKRGSRSETVTLALAAEMLLSAGVVSNAVEGLAKAQEAISSGRALETFGRMIASLGGPADFVERPWAHMPKAAVELVVEAPQAGMLTSCRAREIGMAVIGLGGGRIVPSDTVDHSVGVTDFLPLGTRVEKGDVIARIHARDEASAARARAELLASYTIAEGGQTSRPAIVERISS